METRVDEILTRIALQSRVRRITLTVLIRHRSSWLPLSEIYREGGLTASQAIGAIRGTRGYDPGLSLLNLRIVQQREVQISSKRKRKVYQLSNLSPREFEVIEQLLSRYKRDGER
jgi:predicted transcriptional regulator with HTH domain